MSMGATFQERWPGPRLSFDDRWVDPPSYRGPAGYRDPGISTMAGFMPDTPSDPMLSVAQAFKMGQLAGMDDYVEAHPEQTFAAWDKAQAEKEKRREAEAKLPQLDDTVPGRAARLLQTDPLTGKVVALAKQHEADKQIAGLFVPQSLTDLGLMLATGGFGRVGSIAAGALGATFDPDTAQAGVSPRQAKAMRKARAARLRGEEPVDPGANWRMSDVADEARFGIGGNNPPEAVAAVPSPPAMTPAQAYNAWQRALPTPQPVKVSTELPSLRGLPVDEAVEIARRQPHLIPGGESTPGRYVGAPRDIGSKAALNAQRRAFDAMLAEEPRAITGNWYGRQRGGIAETTGNTPLSNRWASALHGQYSAGVSPESEMAFSLKDLNGLLAGIPQRAYLGDQWRALQRAAAANDPNLLRLDKKTAEYAKLSSPDQGVPGTTGVNDFRYGYVHGYRTPQGGVMDKTFSPQQHSWLDYETALAVDRANKANLGGRSNWTGEQIQEVPWIVDKANDLQSRNPNLSRADALTEALRTSADFLPKHTYFATYEPQPARGIGHMTGSETAPYSEKVEYARDPRSNWAFAPGGRDVIYSGFAVPGTGVPGDPGLAMRVRPTIPMQGIYQAPGQPLEFNPGHVARPLGGFQTPEKTPSVDPDTGKKRMVVNDPNAPFKRTPEAEIALLNAGEAVRGYIDAQNASTWSKAWLGGPNKQMGSLFFERSGPATQAELLQARALGAQHGLRDAYDTGRGIILTDFSSTPQGGSEFDKALKQGAFKQLGLLQRARVEGGYIGREDALQKPGSGEATEQLLSYVNRTPQIRDALNSNADIAKAALDRLERDKDWAARWGAPREDIQRAREIIAQGPGWIDRLEAAKAAGVLLPATLLAVFAGMKGEGHAQQ